MTSQRRHFLLRALACLPRGAAAMLPRLTTVGPSFATLAMVAPPAARGADAIPLDTAPFFSHALARAVGGSMIAAEWRGDYALATRLADADLDRARRSGSGSAAVLADALCSRAAVALLAGNAGQAQGLLEEAQRSVADDAQRKAWVEAYGYAAHARGHRILPGGMSSITDDLIMQGRLRIPPSDRPETPAMDWISTEYFSLAVLMDSALEKRNPTQFQRPRSNAGDDMVALIAARARAGQRQRVMLAQADALRRSGRRTDALPVLQAVRRAFEQAQDGPGVLATEILEGDWFAAPLTTPEELNFYGGALVSAFWESLELDARDVDDVRARALYERAETRARMLKAPRALAALALRRGLLARNADDLADAERWARQAMEGFDACGDRSGYWTARWHAALVRAASGRPAHDDSVAVALGEWGRGDGSYSHAFGLGLIGERAARHSLLRTGSPEVTFAIHHLTETLFNTLGAWLTLAQTSGQRADELSQLGDHVGANAAMVAAAVAMDQRLAAQQGPPAYELSLKLAEFSARVYWIAAASSQPDAIETAAGRVSRYISKLRASAASLRRGDQRDRRLVGLESSVVWMEEQLRPAPAHVAWLRGLDHLRNGEREEAEKQFLIVEQAAAAPGSAELRLKLLTLTYSVNMARRNRPAAAAVARSQFDVGPEAEKKFMSQLAQSLPSDLGGAEAGLRAVWSQNVLLANQLAFKQHVMARSFDDAAEHLAVLERLAGPVWWRSSQQPWSERADCARLREGQGRLDEAAAIYQESINLLENRRSALRADVLKVSLAGQPAVAAIYGDAAHNAIKRMERATNAAEQRQLGDQAFEHIERVKARGLLDLLGGERALRNTHAPSRAGTGDDLATLLRSWQRSQMRVATWQGLLANNAGAGPGTADGRQAFLKQKIGEEAKRLAELDQALARRGPAAPQLPRADGALLNPQQVAGLLPARTVLLHMTLLDDDLLLCAISASGDVVWHRSAVDAVGLRGDMRRLRFLCEQRGVHADINARAGRIAKALLDPMDHVIAAHEQLVVVPHGPAYAVPFAALPWRGAPLAERLAVTQIPSASVLPFLLRTAPLPQASMLAIGNPARMAYKAAFDRTAQPLPPLPEAEAEARAVAAGYAGSTVITGASATAAAVRKELPRHRILHLATHGVMSEDAPLLSALLLADGESLTLDELIGMRLNADLVVLSACNSGTGKENDGNDVLGFTRGLLVAGARSAIVSLWPVNDAATRVLMVRFYAELRRGLSSAAALRTAQMALREMPEQDSSTSGATTPPFRHPHYWAAFVLVG